MEKNKKKMEEKGREIEVNLVVLALIALLLINLMPIIFATPTGPSSINVTANETRAATSGVLVNISGGRIATLNLTAVVQNPHWKAFVGDINGRFTLDDASGSTIYNWSLASISGEVYATRTSGTVTWGSITCANTTHIRNEDIAMFHTGTDNITTTFSVNNTGTFVVAGTTISPNQCKAIHTFVNNVSQSANFEEILLHDGTNVVFTTTIENNVQGFDGASYDFQMIVPENGSSTWTGTTPYYVYVEVS